MGGLGRGAAALAAGKKPMTPRKPMKPKKNNAPWILPPSLHPELRRTGRTPRFLRTPSHRGIPISQPFLACKKLKVFGGKSPVVKAWPGSTGRRRREARKHCED